MWRIKLPTVTQVSLSNMSSYTAFTNNDIQLGKSLKNSNTLQFDQLIWTNTGQSFYLANGDGRHYRVAAGTEITESFTSSGITDAYPNFATFASDATDTSDEVVKWYNHPVADKVYSFPTNQ